MTQQEIKEIADKAEAVIYPFDVEALIAWIQAFIAKMESANG